MKISKGQHLHVNHTRKGKFDAVALEDFDTETTEFYPIALAKGHAVRGISLFNYWLPGEGIPCRKSLCSVEVIS